jgi:hypothetical protein
VAFLPPCQLSVVRRSLGIEFFTTDDGQQTKDVFLGETSETELKTGYRRSDFQFFIFYPG